MDTTSLSACEYGDEDYIDMELSSSPSASSILCCSTNSSPQSREFEFQMSTTTNHQQTTTSPADHLFHKGKLLPLYLLPPPTSLFEEAEDSYYSLPFTNTSTPLDSCNISPSESCRASCELNPDDYLLEWSNELNNHPTKISWAKKLKLIKHSILGHKLKASTAYLKSLFVKSACSHDSSAKPNCAAATPPIPKADEISKRKPTIATVMNNVEKEGVEDNVQRRSFSSAIKRHSPTKCLSSSSSNSSSGSSSFSLNSNGLHELHCLRRSSSATEIEGSIEAAIAHCKKSHQMF